MRILTPPRLLPLACLLLVGEATISACGEARSTLTVFVRTRAYPRPRCAKGPLEHGRLHPRGRPLAGVKVTLKPVDLVATTDRRGAAVFRDLPPGKLTPFYTAAAIRPTLGRALNIRSGENRTVEQVLYPCITAGKDRREIGFGTRVALSATNRCGSPWRDVSYRWSQVEGPSVAGSVKSWTSRRLVFTTLPLRRLRPLPREPRVLSFTHQQAGEYVFKLEARNTAGQTSVSHVMVTSTSATSGLTSVAPFHTYYFAGPTSGPYDWKLVRRPRGWKVLVGGTSTRTPWVKPIPRVPVGVPQTIELRDRHSMLTFSIVVGNWNLVRRDCGRAECHFSMERNWQLTTRHAHAWQRLLDGVLKVKRALPAESCADCHAIGFSPGVDVGGYDDIARQLRVEMPRKLQAGTYAALPAAVKEVSNVYCLGCHGPARLDPPVTEQPGLFATAICARCHDRPPEQSLVAEWRKTTHATTDTTTVNAPARRPGCADCHSAQGVYYRNYAIARPHSTRTAVLNCCETTEPITCQACHNPMYNSGRQQLFEYGPISTSSGLEVANAGSAAVCIRCHHADVDVASPQALAERRAPHSPQADLTYGRAGFAMGRGAKQPFRTSTACVAKTDNSCVSCHMHKPRPAPRGPLAAGGHTFSMARLARRTATTAPTRGAENVAACRGCHRGVASFNFKARGDHDGDGRVEGVKDEVTGLLALLEERLRQLIGERRYVGCGPRRDRGVWIKRGARERLVIVDAKGRDLGDCNGNGALEREEQPFVFPAADSELHKAAYNYLAVTRDRSTGLHNHPYVVALLKHTLAALGGGETD